MNWNEIEKLIDKYKDRFEDKEPSAQHLASFEAKLTQRFQKSYSFKPYNLLRIAVSIVIIVTCVSLSFIIFSNIKQASKSSMTQTNVELKEAEMYYTEQINTGLNKIRSQKMSDPRQKSAIFSDLNDMDKNYQQLKHDLDKNPNDERVIHAIIEHYQVKLDAIDQIINSISFSQNNLKPQSHEQKM